MTKIFVSCKKELTGEGCKNNNKPPIANAEADQTIIYHKHSVGIDGPLPQMLIVLSPALEAPAGYPVGTHQIRKQKIKASRYPEKEMPSEAVRPLIGKTRSYVFTYLPFRDSIKFSHTRVS